MKSPFIWEIKFHEYFSKPWFRREHGSKKVSSIWLDFILNWEIFHESIAGQCYGTSFDNHFSLVSKSDKNHYLLQGFSKSAIEFNETKKEWKHYLYSNKNVFAICNETDGNYPFGTHNWYIFNDTCRDNLEFRIQPLSFSACSDNEFVCKDGGW